MSQFAIRGVIEGFYGRTWSWTERQRMVDFMGRHNYNLFVYAPKNDPIHRNRWQEPYLPEELDRFAALAQRCKSLGIEFCFGISPLQYHYTREAYFETLWQKLVPIYDQGIRSFTVLLDDMPDKFHHPGDDARFPSIAHAQAWLNNAVLKRLEGLGGGKLIFCPTEYCGEGESDYLRTLGQQLHPEIEIFWTGTEVCAQYLRTEDARRVGKSLQRPVLYWDNYPVNDGEMRFRPHIRPVRGRDADLAQACRGIVSNGSLQPEATMISLHTYAAYMANPAGYDPEQAWERALLEVCGNSTDAAAVGVLGDLTRWSALERGHQLHNGLAPKLSEFWRAWGGPPPEAGPDLTGMPESTTNPGQKLTRAEALSVLQSEFRALQAAAHHLLRPAMSNPYLQAELSPWSEKLLGWAEVGLLALDVLSRSLANPGDPAIAPGREAMLDRLLQTHENFHWVSGDLIDQFSRRCLFAAAALAPRSSD